ncbi:hypothetical protein SAY86_006708 [Trapa natans]|uniref:RING-type E3 ubiquitin transferase n=1 Tax=Trapa natans TaxID=22666 RepID=A0AAN7QX17_TRANT|nr:hypothetical protein SAY86_006708 [Trapa natans]
MSPPLPQKSPNNGETLIYPPPQPPVEGQESARLPSSSNRISPAILLVIVILAAVFFLCGLVHLLIRFLMKKPSASLYQSDRFAQSSRSHVLQRQLQQLFRLHDSGLDQSIVDALPVFHFRDIVGLKEPFDCAICLCEFSDDDKLRLLPVCSHAFHISCIDTWLLSNSACPLCRGTLMNSSGLLAAADSQTQMSCSNTWAPQDVFHSDDDEDAVQSIGKRVFSVRLGKLRNLSGVEILEMGRDTRGREGSSRDFDRRRCYSMGSYPCQYVVGDLDLQVALSSPGQNQDRPDVRAEEGKKIMARGRGESFSVSKIWLWTNSSKNISRVPSSYEAGIS